MARILENPHRNFFADGDREAFEFMKRWIAETEPALPLTRPPSSASVRLLVTRCSHRAFGLPCDTSRQSVPGRPERRNFDSFANRDFIVAAFVESTLKILRLIDRAGLVTLLVAKTIMDCAKTGKIDRVRLRDCALEAVTKQ